MENNNVEVSFVSTDKIMPKVNDFQLAKFQCKIDFDATPTATIALIVVAHDRKIKTRECYYHHLYNLL